MNQIGWMLVVLGLVVVAAGLLFLVADRVPFLGHLPGDFSWQRDNLRVYAPLGTCLLLSVVLSLLLTLVTNLLGRQ